MIRLVVLPKIDEMLAYLHNSKFITSLHLRSEYCNIKLSEAEMRHKSAFTNIIGKYKFLRMPFRLPQGPAYFIALMQKVFGQFNDFCFFHMDDVLIHDANGTDHLNT